MTQYIDKSALVAEIERLIDSNKPLKTLDPIYCEGLNDSLGDILSFLDTLEVKDPYEQCIQYDSIKAGIQDHAETYSFNIESMLFNQLTKEQQKLWRKEIEQAVISGGEAGVELARDPRYKENLEVKEINNVWNNASDFPKAESGRSILLIEDNGHAELLKSPSAERLLYFRPTNLKMWAYVDELLSITTHFDAKEVELEQEVKDYIYTLPHSRTGIPGGWKCSWPEENVIEIAKHFFELGLKSQKG